MKYWLGALIFLGLPACTPSSNSEAPQKTQATDLAKRGRAIYVANCLACHNTDPKVDGTLGPAVHGSSKELLIARVLKGQYPPGYKPKRSTHTMVALPHLESEIEALHIYLNSP